MTIMNKYKKMQLHIRTEYAVLVQNLVYGAVDEI
jgi:hypothetical protein